MTAEQDRHTAMNITNLNRSVALPQQLTVQAPFNNSNFFQTANSAENFKPRKDKVK